MSPDIILYAIVAVVLLARLWSLFGQRNDSDAQRPNPFAIPAPQQRNMAQPSSLAPATPNAAGDPRAPVPKLLLLPPESLGGRLEQIKMLYPAFDEKDFLKATRTTFTRIVEAFAKGDLTGVEPLLGPAVLAQFKSAIAAREAAGQKLECRVIAVPDVEITAARVDDKRIFTTVSIASEQESVLRDAGGSVIGGQPGQREKAIDTWVFMRDTSSTSSEWQLVETRA